MDRSLLARATEGTDAPTPGYLYVDLTKAATSNPTACSEMAQYLTRKLASKQNPNIKAKCCKVIAKLAESVPRNQFRRCIAQDAQAVAAIKEAINFRGPMDPVQGDTKNEKVRVAAREALDAVYNEAPSSEMSGSAGGGGMQNMSASYGSAPHAGGGYGGQGGGGGNRMEGIGNPMYSDPRLDARYNGTAAAGFKEAIAEAGEVLAGMIKDPLARNVGQYPAEVPNRGHSGNLPGYGPTYGRPPPGATELSRQTGGQWTMASNRGPGAYAAGGATPQTSEYHKERDTGFNSWNQAGATSATAGVPGGSWGTPSVAGRAREPAYGTPSVSVISNPNGGGGSTAGGAKADGTYEKNLILELCPPGGVKPVPPPDKLQQFARNVPSLNADLVCPVLLDFLEEGQPWIIRAKALCVMETAIQNGIQMHDGSNPYKTFFHACHEEIEPLAHHARTAIAEPAKRVLVLLGFTPGPAPEVAASAPASAPPPPVPAADLFDFGVEETVVSAPAAPPSHPPPPPPSEAPPPPPAAAAAPSMFGGMTIKGAPPAAAAPPAVAPVAPAPPVPSAPVAPAASLLDFGDSFAPTSLSDVNGTANMFGDMTVKEEKNEADAAPPSTSGSAFSFMNKDAAPAAPVAPKPAVFDPMANFGGVSPTSTPASMSMPTHMSPMPASKVMSLSTEQMQAMAYQQMLMQQQYQMQMAMMQGRGGGGGAMPAPPQMQFRQSSGSMSGSGLTMGFKPQQPHIARKDDKKFDFVKDAMTASTKKN